MDFSAVNCLTKTDVYAVRRGWRDYSYGFCVLDDPDPELPEFVLLPKLVLLPKAELLDDVNALEEELPRALPPVINF